MQKLNLAASGFVQVYFVAVNTYFLANKMYLGVLVAAFLISLLWSWNVKRVAFGSVFDRYIYAAGAALGSVAGLWSSAYIVELLT
jgi:hypothetical protein